MLVHEDIGEGPVSIPMPSASSSCRAAGWDVLLPAPEASKHPQFPFPPHCFRPQGALCLLAASPGDVWGLHGVVLPINTLLGFRTSLVLMESSRRVLGARASPSAPTPRLHFLFGIKALSGFVAPLLGLPQHRSFDSLPKTTVGLEGSSVPIWSHG